VIDEVLSVGDFAFQRKGLEKMRAIAKSGATVVFVSHNLQAVAEFCHRGILLEKGRIAADGPTDQVIRRYLDTADLRSTAAPRGPVHIVGAKITGASGETGRFSAGQKARIAVSLEATAPAEKVAVVIQLFNSDFYDVFNTSSERLGHPPLTMSAGAKFECEFDVSLHLGPGTYYLGVYLYRYDAEIEYDHVFPTTSFVVTSDRATQGSANLYPAIAGFKGAAADHSASIPSRNGTAPLSNQRATARSLAPRQEERS
jgi:hypothetical protein